MSRRTLIPALAALAALCFLSPVAAGSLIHRDPGAAPRTAPAVVTGPQVARETVRVDASVLAAAPETLWLELAPGEGRLAFRNDAERTADGGLVWRGHFADGDPGYRSITLSLHGGLVYGSFEAGAVFHTLRPRAGRSSELRTVRAAGALDCDVGRGDAATNANLGTGAPLAAAPEPSPPGPPVFAYRAPVAAASDGRTLSILVAYLPRVAARWGGEEYVVAYAHHAVDNLNTAFRNSRIDARAFLSGVGEWDTTGPHNAYLLSQAPGSSVLRALRDAAAADLVTVLTDSSIGGGCGIANVMRKSELGPQFAPDAYSVSKVDCDDGRLTWIFVHETGHVLGANHPPGTAIPELERVFPYALAYDGNHFSTIMASFPVLLFSNPLVTYLGEPAGIENERDNARAMNQTVPVAADFRAGGSELPPATVPPPLPPPPIEVPAAPTELRATVLSATEVRLEWKDNGSGEIAFRIEGRKQGEAFAEVAEVPRDTVEHVVGGLEPATTYRFRVLAIGAQANSPFYSNEVAVTTREARPTAPAGLAAEPFSAHAVTLLFDAVARATGYQVEVRSSDPAADRTLPLDFAAAGTGLSATVDGLAVDEPHTFRVRAVNAAGVSPWSAEASATTDTAGPGDHCVADVVTHCLLGGRFAVTARWRNQRPPFNHGAAAAQAVAGSERTGLFTFFSPTNVELAVKMLDGRAVNGSFWHFFGALSDVEYWVTVRDTEEGTSRTYHNPPFEVCGRGDTAAFPGSPDEPAPEALLLAAEPAEAEACAPGSGTLCLAGGRFEVEVGWENPRVAGDAGVGRVFAAAGGERSGHFWFFRPDNLELSVKILDGRAINGHFWIFWGGLSDVGYTIHVTDTTSGQTHDFENPPLTLCGGAVTDVL
jgi:hypothetical protein